MVFADPLTGELRQAWVFVAALSYSAYSYVEALPDMTLGSWIDAHVHAFEHFGGVGRLLVPDNLRTGVSRSDRYEPALNPAYARLAEHYGTAVIPARVKRPRDKAVVEGSVRFVAGQVAAVLRNRQFVGLAELNEAIFDEVAAINARPFQKREDSRLVVFERDEKPLLIPLPPVRFELADLRKAKAGPNYHVQVDRNFYSVPARLIGQSLDVRITSATVEVFDGMERVASHPRFNGVFGRYSTLPAHMPGLASQPARGLDPGTVRAVGRDHRPPHGGRDPGDPRVPQDRRAVLPVVSGGDVAGQEARRHRPPRGHLQSGVGGHPRPVVHADQEAVGRLDTRRTAPCAITRRCRVRARRRLLREPGMIDIETLTRLKMMRLSGMAEYFENLADTPTAATLSGPELVKQAVDWEYERRRDSKLHRLRRQAGLAQPGADLADLKAMPGRSVDSELIARLADRLLPGQTPRRHPARTHRSREDLRRLRPGEQGLPAIPQGPLPVGRRTVRPDHDRRTHRRQETLPRHPRQGRVVDHRRLVPHATDPATSPTAPHPDRPAPQDRLHDLLHPTATRAVARPDGGEDPRRRDRRPDHHQRARHRPRL